MAVAVLPQTIVSFSGFELDLTCGELHKNGQKVALPPKAFEVLRALVERPGEVVTREELRTKLWSADTFVEFDDSLNHAVNKLRQVLADSAENPRFIETLPRHGYRFIATIERVPPPEVLAGPPRRRRAVIGIATLGRFVGDLAVFMAFRLVQVAGLRGKEPTPGFNPSQFFQWKTLRRSTTGLLCRGHDRCPHDGPGKASNYEGDLAHLGHAFQGCEAASPGNCDGSGRGRDSRARCSGRLPRAHHRPVDTCPTDTHLWDKATNAIPAT